MEQLHLPAQPHVHGTMTLPGSKSISNRTLLLAALAQGETHIHDVLASDDTARMLEALDTLGVVLTKVSDQEYVIQGCAGHFPNKKADLFLGNAGTAFRPLTAALALSNGDYHLHGVPRMHERPIGDLIDALSVIGADVSYDDNDGYPPLTIKPAGIKVDRTIPISGSVSSQFLTALLMALPLTGQAATIEVSGELISKPYIAITLNLMAKFGVTVKHDNWQRFYIPANAPYQAPDHIYIEGDASSASYFIAAGAIAGNVTIKGIDDQSIQGDIQFSQAAEMMGAKVSFAQNQLTSQQADQIKAIDLDCNHIPDAAMTLAVMALFADNTTTLRNIASWRVKETDRIAAMATELRKVGATIIEGKDYIQVTPPVELTPNAEIDTYDDHRMAMCFSLISLGARGVPVIINDPNCVAKTFPTYFDVLESIRA